MCKVFLASMLFLGGCSVAPDEPGIPLVTVKSQAPVPASAELIWLEAAYNSVHSLRTNGIEKPLALKSALASARASYPKDEVPQGLKRIDHFCRSTFDQADYVLKTDLAMEDIKRRGYKAHFEDLKRQPKDNPKETSDSERYRKFGLVLPNGFSTTNPVTYGNNPFRRDAHFSNLRNLCERTLNGLHLECQNADTSPVRKKNRRKLRDQEWLDRVLQAAYRFQQPDVWENAKKLESTLQQVGFIYPTATPPQACGVVDKWFKEGLYEATSVLISRRGLARTKNLLGKKEIEKDIDQHLQRSTALIEKATKEAITQFNLLHADKNPREIEELKRMRTLSR